MTPGSLLASPTEEQRLAARVRPRESAVGRQRWNHLLFAHWKVPVATVQATLPPGLWVDTYQGDAYLGIVPFYMQRIRPAFVPALPWVSWFLELNLRTYVYDRKGQPGVWFYSLDCNRRLAVEIARRAFHLPYHPARIKAWQRGTTHHYECRRQGAREPTARYVWEPGRESSPAVPGSLDFFLVERYALFASIGNGQLCQGRVHHQPYRLNRPTVTALGVEPAAQAGFSLTGPPDSLLGASAVDVEIFPLRRIVS